MNAHFTLALAPLFLSIAAWSAGANETHHAFKPEVLGPVYDIRETDMIEEIHSKLEAYQRSGQLQAKVDQAIQQSEKTIHSPQAVKGLSVAMRDRTYFYDPTVQVMKDVLDKDGRIVVPAGTMVNALDYQPLREWLLFLDGRDPRQLKLGVHLDRKYKGLIKPILVAGSPIEVGRAWKRRVYFDQAGYLTTRLNIVAVPALVSQQQRILKIDEIAPRNKYE